MEVLEKRVRQLQGTPATPAQPNDAVSRANEDGAADLGSSAPALQNDTSGRSTGSNQPADGTSEDGGRGVNLERWRSGDAAGSSPSAGLPPGQVAGWNNGFYIQSPDQRFIFRITGQVQADYRAYLDDRDTTDIDTFVVRRARLGLEAVLLNYYEFRLMPDFGQGRAIEQDAYMNIHYWDAFQIEVGKFKQPFSYEQLIQDRYVPTLERSLIDQLVPARDVGAMIHGQNLLDHHLDYAFAVSNGQINGDFDTNNNKDINGRIAIHPFGGPDQLSIFRYLELAVSGSFGNQNQPVQPNALTTPLGVRWFVFNSTVQASGARSRWSPEASYFLGPFGAAAQWFHIDQQMLPSATGIAANRRIPVSGEGFYVLTTLLLTGEKRTGYSQAIAPNYDFEPRNPFSHPGAWELVARVSRLHLGNDVFLPGANQLANPLTNASGATEMTLGFNWYFNRQVRMQFNWEHSWFDRRVQLGPGTSGLLEHQDALGTRFQIIF